MKGWDMIYYAKINKRKAEVAKLISGKIDFRAKKIIRQKGTLYNNMCQSTKKTQQSNI